MRLGHFMTICYDAVCFVSLVYPCRAVGNDQPVRVLQERMSFSYNRLLIALANDLNSWKRIRNESHN